MKTKRNLLVVVTFGLMILLTCSCSKNEDEKKTETKITDVDGNEYHTVTIGDQVWMLENLKTTRYKDGTPIPEVTDDYEWSALTSAAYCNFDNIDSISTIYGRLYNWYAVNTGKLAPEGWRVPTANDWLALIKHIGGDSVAGSKLKETGTVHWSNPNTGATNESGFTALAGGLRYKDEGTFMFNRGIAAWWCSTEISAEEGAEYYVGYIYSEGYFESGRKNYGFSVRCIKN